MSKTRHAVTSHGKWTARLSRQHNGLSLFLCEGNDCSSRLPRIPGVNRTFFSISWSNLFDVPSAWIQQQLLYSEMMNNLQSTWSSMDDSILHAGLKTSSIACLFLEHLTFIVQLHSLFCLLIKMTKNWERGVMFLFRHDRMSVSNVMLLTLTDIQMHHLLIFGHSIHKIVNHDKVNEHKH